MDIREVGDGEKGVLVEDFAVKEPMQEVPRHWSLAGPEAMGESGGYLLLCVGRKGDELRDTGGTRAVGGGGRCSWTGWSGFEAVERSGGGGIQAASADCFICFRH